MNTLHDLHQVIGGRLLGNGDVPLGRIAADSRQVAPGQAFWALPGPHHEGEECVDEAFQCGAAGAVVRREVPAPADRWLLCVENTTLALETWARHRREQVQPAAIAIAGRVGKATTRHMLEAVLTAAGETVVATRNNQSHHAVALAVADLSPTERLVIELAPEQGRVPHTAIDLAEASIGVVTQLSDGHPAGTCARDTAVTAMELLASLPAGGLAVLGDDPWLRKLIPNCKADVVTVGQGSQCDLRAVDVQAGQAALGFRVAGCRFHVPVWGRHHLNAALLAIAVGCRLGRSMGDIAEALRQFTPLPSHCTVFETRGATIINDTCDASSPAMYAALEMLRELDATGRRIVVCGDLESTLDAPAIAHRELGRAMGRLAIDLLLTCGEYAGDVAAAARATGMPRSRAIACRTPEEILPILSQALLPGDVVLVKGNRGLALERVVDALRNFPRRRAA